MLLSLSQVEVLSHITPQEVRTHRGVHAIVANHLGRTYRGWPRAKWPQPGVAPQGRSPQPRCMWNGPALALSCWRSAPQPLKASATQVCQEAKKRQIKSSALRPRQGRRFNCQRHPKALSKCAVQGFKGQQAIPGTPTRPTLWMTGTTPTVAHHRRGSLIQLPAGLAKARLHG